MFVSCLGVNQQWEIEIVSEMYTFQDPMDTSNQEDDGADILAMYQTLPDDDLWEDAATSDILKYLFSCRLVKIPPAWENILLGYRSQVIHWMLG